MQRTVVEERRWISPEESVEGLALAQLAPGPLAAQLAMYLGYIRGGWLGATLSGFAFILPSFFMVWALAAAYVRYGGLWWMQALFYGSGAAVIGVMARSVPERVNLSNIGSPGVDEHWLATRGATTATRVSDKSALRAPPRVNGCSIN